MVPESGPPGVEEGFVAVDVEESGDGTRVDVGGEGEVAPGGLGWVGGVGGEAVKSWRVGKQECFLVCGVFGGVVAGAGVGEGLGSGLEVGGEEEWAVV